MSFKVAVGIAAISLAFGVCSAAPITPTFNTFGPLPGATFGGSGIPNNAVANVQGTSDGLQLGLTAHQRFVGPDLANDGKGTFTAFSGVSQEPPSPGNPFATWNFAFYISGGALANLNFLIEYDFDPAADTDSSLHGNVFFPGLGYSESHAKFVELGDGFLGNVGPGPYGSGRLIRSKCDRRVHFSD